MKLYVKIALSALLLMAMWCAMIMMQTYPALSQPITPPGVAWVTSAPTGSCGYGPIYITQSTGAMTACINGTYGSVGGGGGKLTATFLLCAGGCTLNETSNWKWSAPFSVTFTGCVIDAQTYPTGATGITVDVQKNAGATSIFSTPSSLALAAGSSTFSTQTSMSAAAALSQGDFLVAKLTQTGSIVAGQYVNVVCTATY